MHCGVCGSAWSAEVTALAGDITVVTDKRASTLSAGGDPYRIGIRRCSMFSESTKCPGVLFPSGLEYGLVAVDRSPSVFWSYSLLYASLLLRVQGVSFLHIFVGIKQSHTARLEDATLYTLNRHSLYRAMCNFMKRLCLPTSDDLSCVDCGRPSGAPSFHIDATRKGPCKALINLALDTRTSKPATSACARVDLTFYQLLPSRVLGLAVAEALLTSNNGALRTARDKIAEAGAAKSASETDHAPLLPIADACLVMHASLDCIPLSVSQKLAIAKFLKQLASSAAVPVTFNDPDKYLDLKLTTVTGSISAQVKNGLRDVFPGLAVLLQDFSELHPCFTAMLERVEAVAKAHSFKIHTFPPTHLPATDVTFLETTAAKGVCAAFCIAALVRYRKETISRAYYL